MRRTLPPPPGVPHLAADLVEGVGDPGDQAVRVEATHHLRGAFGDPTVDPFGGVGGHTSPSTAVDKAGLAAFRTLAANRLFNVAIR